MITLYKVLGIILYPALIILIYVRKFLKKEDTLRFKEKIFSSCFNIVKKKKKIIWFHAASIGEFKSIIPIIEKIQKNKYVLSSLADKSIYFFDLNENKKIINFERVEVFERVRDIRFYKNKLYLFLENTASILLVYFSSIAL